MMLMRPWSLILVLVCAGCMLRLPKPGQLGIAVKTSTRVQVRAQVHVQGQAQAPAPEVLVPLQGAPVVEFFGIPLEDAQDVVFVLDCSGSMSGPAQGRMAQIQAPPADAPPLVAPPPGALPPGVPASASQPPGAPTEPPPPPPGALPPGPPPPGASPDQTASAQPAPTTQPASSSVLGPTKLDVAQYELVDALRRLPPGTRMNVLFFSSDLDAYAPALVPLDEGSRDQLISFVQGTRPLGSTALAPAMRTAFLMNARRVVLLSDGLGNVGGNAAALLRDAREAMRGGVRIDTIGLGAGQDSRTLATLANESGGLYQAL